MISPSRRGDKAERLWNQYRARTSSVVADAFAGQLQSSVECHACGKASTSYDPFWDLSLPLRAPRKGSARGGGGGGGDGGGTLSRTGSLLRYMSGGGSGVGRLGVLDCLEAFAEDDALSGADAFSCPRCKVRGAATKRLRVRRWPRVLVLHLKRFQWNDRGRPGRKIDAVVGVPAKISLAPFLAEDARGGDDDDGPEYRLFAVTNHVGSLSGGHYTAACDAVWRSGTRLTTRGCPRRGAAVPLAERVRADVRADVRRGSEAFARENV